MKGKRNETVPRVANEAETVAFNFGVLYRTIEEHCEHTAAESGGKVTFAEVAARMGELLSRKAQWITELVSEVREVGMGTGPTDEGSKLGGQTALHVRPRDSRPLKKKRFSAKARANMRKAQRARWDRYNAKKKTGKSHSPGIKAYWASMTPLQRSQEIQRRQAVSALKRAAA